MFFLAGALCLYLIAVNIIAFAAYGIDKRRAIRHEFRISERTLLGLAVIGGSAGALCGMLFFRHKTRKPKFAVGLPLIIAVQAAAVMFFSGLMFF